MSCGLLPDQGVNTICWFSPMSGIASTGTGSRGIEPISQSNGATITPQKVVMIITIATIKRCLINEVIKKIH